MKETVNNIFHFVPTLMREVEAFTITRTRHDRSRASKALGYLEDQIADLRKELSEAQLSDEGGDTLGRS